MARIESEAALRAHYKAASERVYQKVLDRLDKHCRRFIALSPFLVIGTQGAAGRGDVSPRGEAPGFVQVLDDTTLAIPDRPGNNRLDSLSNMLANPKVGLIFLIPGVHETLRVNGAAGIDDDRGLRERFLVGGKAPVTVILVSVEEAYLHCAKSILRSRLWEPEARIERSQLPSMNQMISDHIKAEPGDETQEEMLARYGTQLY